MLKKAVARGPGGTVLLVDSITLVEEDDSGAVVVSGSHGGISSAEFALAVPLQLVVFNDAGGGKDDAGIAALARLQQRGVAACTVSHASARIGDAWDSWDAGIVSHVNAAAAGLGLAPGAALQAALRRLVGAC
ncbi:MAG: hypothetical protein KF788_13215 [Piscinibacter sp.]|nr:hypothetical protein [Piscinibacter sp.]